MKSAWKKRGCFIDTPFAWQEQISVKFAAVAGYLKIREHGNKYECV